MKIKNAIIDLLKKIKCKCKCFGSVEIEIIGCDTTHEVEPQREITPTPSPHRSPLQSPLQQRRSPQPPPRELPPHIYTELV